MNLLGCGWSTVTRAAVAVRHDATKEFQVADGIASRRLTPTRRRRDAERRRADALGGRGQRRPIGATRRRRDATTPSAASPDARSTRAVGSAVTTGTVAGGMITTLRFCSDALAGASDPRANTLPPTLTSPSASRVVTSGAHGTWCTMGSTRVQVLVAGPPATCPVSAETVVPA